jgi:(S)-ureidoglycine aminohydrolase
MTPLFGQTRTRFCPRHALITTDGHVASIVPGIEGARVVAHITPAMGAGFAQSTIDLEPKGRITLGFGESEHFFYVQDGTVEAKFEDTNHVLTAGSYLYLPVHKPAQIAHTGGAPRLICFEKKYRGDCGLDDVTMPPPILGSTAKVPGQPFLGNPKALLQTLLPDTIAFDLAVNIFTYQPGATLPFVETHVMEHGLLMLSGQGIYRLEDEWYPVKAGDVIWMAPYCPQWFAAIGDEPASYIYYKDVNRALLT